MFTNDIPALFESLCIELELEHWSFEFDNARRRNGICRFSTKTIGLSVHFATRNSKEQVEETLRHEIAHAKVGPGHGHDHVWKEMAIKCGSFGERCTGMAESERTEALGSVVRSEGPYKLDCPKCGFHGSKFRWKIGVSYACPKCSPKRYSANHLLVMTYKP